MEPNDSATGTEGVIVGAETVAHDSVRIVGHAIIEKYWGDDRELYPEPYEVVDGGYNNFTTAGITYMLNALIVAGSPLFNAANAAIGVGDSSAAFGAGQTNLQGAVVTTDRIRKGVNSIPTVSGNVLTAVATFATTEANFIWNEWGLFNNVTDAAGTMLNRAVPASLGTKTSASAWTITITITVN